MRRFVPEVLRDEPEFRRLFLGQLLSVIGDRVMLVALPFAVLSAGGGLADVGLVAAAQTIPFLVFALAGGVIADRGDRRRVMVLSDAARLVMQASAGLLLVTDHAQVWHLAALAVLYGSADAFFQPALTGLLPQTVSHTSQLQHANALRSLTMSVGSVAGPGLAGLLLALTQPGYTLLFDASTFAVSIVFLLRLSPRAEDLVAAENAGQPGGGFLEDLRGGWRAVTSRPWIVWGLAGFLVYTVVVLPSVYVLGPVLAKEELGGASAWALITVAFGAGTICGDLVLLRWRPVHAMRVCLIALAVASCQAIIFGSGLPLAAICGLEFLAAIGTTMTWGLWETSLTEHVPTAELSRVSSFDYLVTGGLAPIGTLLAAPVADGLGIHTALALMSAVGVACSLAILSVRSVRTLGRGTA